MTGRHRPGRRVPPPYVAGLLVALVLVLVLGVAVVIMLVLVALVPLDVSLPILTTPRGGL